MHHDCCPQAVKIIHKEREQNSYNNDLRDADRRHPRIEQMQGCKCHRVADDGYPRIFISSAKLLVQIASVNDLLRSGLDHDHEEEGKKERRIESVEGENNVSEDPGHDNAESVYSKAEKQADCCPAKVHPIPAESKRPQHRPVILKNTGCQEKRDPYAEKVKIHEQKFCRVLISHDCSAPVSARTPLPMSCPTTTII